MISLVGYTGFVGSNLHARGTFDGLYNSKNAEEAFGTHPDLLIYAGLRAEKYLANTDPQADGKTILQAQRNLEQIGPKRLVLISTIDVFRDPSGKDEDAPVDTEGLHPYGLHRFQLEQWVRQRYPQALIVRLPGLYGLNLKKNFIYDYLHVIPAMLREDKFRELSEKEPRLTAFYTPQPNGFYRCLPLDREQERWLRERFRQLGFTALHFTDSRSVYQFYPLSRLWEDLQTALEHGLTLWHPATEPVSAAEIYQALTGREFRNETAGQPARYDYRTKFGRLFGASGEKYLMTKQQVLSDLKAFTEDYLKGQES